MIPLLLSLIIMVRLFLMLFSGVARPDLYPALKKETQP